MFVRTFNLNLNNNKNILVNEQTILKNMSDKICAICLQETNEIFSIDNYVGNKTVKLMIKELANVEFDQDNCSAKFVCFTCLNKLIELLDFIHQIQDSLKFFQKTIYITYFNGGAANFTESIAFTTQQENVVESLRPPSLPALSIEDASSPVTVVDFVSGVVTGESTSPPTHVTHVDGYCTSNLDNLETELAPFLNVNTPHKSDSGYSSDPVTDIDNDFTSEIEKTFFSCANIDLNKTESLIHELTKIVDDGTSINDYHNNQERVEKEQEKVPNDNSNVEDENRITITRKPVDVVIQNSNIIDISENILNNSNDQVSCCMCTEVFSKVIDLKNHVTQIHPTPKPVQSHPENFKHVCQYCHRGFRLLSSLKTHFVDKQFNEEPLTKFAMQCSLCGKTFRSANGYEFHQKTIHSSEYRHECPFHNCEKSFKLRKELRSHLESHSKKIKAYCDVCGRAFKSKNLFRRHYLSMHAENRIHKCPKCPKRFVLKDTLRSHIASHEGKREFSRIHKCDECDRSYCWRADLLKHKRTHQGIIPYVCHICDKGYLCTANLKYHYETVHDIDVDQI